jgi:hypothetical protein
MEKPREKTNWRRIGLVATILFVPGGFLLGASMAARRRRKGDALAPPATDPPADG